MNQLLLLLPVIFSFLACSNNFPPEGSDLAKRELKGPVKFVEAKNYWAKRRAKPFDLDTLRLADDFREPSKRLWYFNQAGNITKSQYYQEDQPKWEFLHSFDNRGNRIKSLHYDYSRERVLDRTQIFTYDDNDNLIQEAIFDIDSLPISKEVTYYNELQQKIKEVVTHSRSNRITHTATFQYDAQGRVIEKKEERWQNPSVKVIYTYTGNSPNIHTKTVYRADTTITRKETNVYHSGYQWKESTFLAPIKGYKRVVSFNEEGWIAVIKKWSLKEDKKLLSHTKYEYEYDSKGNWTRRAIFENDVLKIVEFRTIAYFQKTKNQ